MPSYQSNPTGNVPVQLLQPGIPSYAYGSLPIGPVCRLAVTSTARLSLTATLQVKVVEGNIPAVGDLITVKATTRASGAFNVTNAVLTAVNINALTGVGSVQFAIGAGTTADGADPGYAAVPITQLNETLATGSSAAFAIPANASSAGTTITWSTMFPAAPSVVSVSLQAALVDLDSEYSSVDTSTSTTGEERFITLTNFRFLRLKVNSVTGTSTIIGKILVS